VDGSALARVMLIVGDEDIRINIGAIIDLDEGKSDTQGLPSAYCTD
jgi:hypothetical protein